MARYDLTLFADTGLQHHAFSPDEAFVASRRALCLVEPTLRLSRGRSQTDYWRHARVMRMAAEPALGVRPMGERLRATP